MLKFKIFEIPEGHSEQAVTLGPEDLDLGDVCLHSADLDIAFYRTQHFIRAELDIHAKLELTCDRSLDAFDFEVNQPYEVLFKADEVEESADENGSVRNFDHARKEIDLEQDVRDTILLNIPTKKLHPRFLDEDGQPKEVFEQKFGESDEEDDDKIDPRWEALKELKD